MTDEIKLPELPAYVYGHTLGSNEQGERVYAEDAMEAYARAAVEQDRQSRDVMYDLSEQERWERRYDEWDRQNSAPASINVEVVGIVKKYGEHGTYIEPTLEGGFCELVEGELVYCADEQLTDDFGRGRVIRTALEAALTPTNGPADDDQSRWYLASLNDGLFIINKKPSPCGTDLPPDWGTPPSMVLNVTDLSQEKAQAIVDAHNATNGIGHD